MTTIPELPSLKNRTTPEFWYQAAEGQLPAVLGLELLSIEPGRATGRMPIEKMHLSPNGFLHAASVVALADTISGVGCMASLPEGASGFTTIELKSNHLGTALDGAIRAEATLAHGGRSTQVWDATVTAEGSGKVIAMFRCTQMVLYPKI